MCNQYIGVAAALLVSDCVAICLSKCEAAIHAERVAAAAARLARERAARREGGGGERRENVVT